MALLLIQELFIIFNLFVLIMKNELLLLVGWQL